MKTSFFLPVTGGSASKGNYFLFEEDCLILVADRVDGDVVPVHNVEGVRVPGVVPGHVPPALVPVWVGEPVADPRQRPVNPHLGPASLLCLL